MNLNEKRLEIDILGNFGVEYLPRCVHTTHFVLFVNDRPRSTENGYEKNYLFLGRHLQATGYELSIVRVRH